MRIAEEKREASNSCAQSASNDLQLAFMHQRIGGEAKEKDSELPDDLWKQSSSFG